MTDTLGFETRQIHAGTEPDVATGARQVPIYQSTAFAFKDAEHARKLFGLEEVGFIYSRLTNPTIAALQARVADLEGGVGAVACSSGHAAQIMALFPLMSSGDHVVASNRLYGGTVTQFTQTIKRFGWSADLVDFDDEANIRAAIQPTTKALFCESIANPAGHITDIEMVAKIADEAGIPLIVDNTVASPYLCNPIAHGATLVVHSATKYLTGNGTVTGGLVVDSGKFDWSASDKFLSLSAPEPAYHGLKFHEALGPMAFTFHSIAIGLRDLGMTMNPQGAHYTLMGIETLSLRMERHVSNALALAKWLEKDERIAKVNYAGLASAKSHDKMRKICPKGAGALMTIELANGFDACVQTVNNVKLLSHVANLGDARSLIIHPASTTHSQLTEDQQIAAGVAPNVIRLSIGIETIEDIINDLDQALV